MTSIRTSRKHSGTSKTFTTEFGRTVIPIDPVFRNVGVERNYHDDTITYYTSHKFRCYPYLSVEADYTSKVAIEQKVNE